MMLDYLIFYNTFFLLILSLSFNIFAARGGRSGVSVYKACPCLPFFRLPLPPFSCLLSLSSCSLSASSASSYSSSSSSSLFLGHSPCANTNLHVQNCMNPNCPGAPVCPKPHQELHTLPASFQKVVHRIWDAQAKALHKA